MSGTDVDRQAMDVDIVCVGFGPATAGFLTTLSRHLVNADGTPAIESPAIRVCRCRCSATSAPTTSLRRLRRGDARPRHSRQPSRSRPGQHPDGGRRSTQEKVVYLLDPHGASRRSAALRFGDGMIRAARRWHRDHAVELPYIPPFLHKEGGLVMSLGQFMQWVGGGADGQRARCRSGRACRWRKR